jgi:hypothetical protein
MEELMGETKKGTFTHFKAKDIIPKFYALTYLKVGPKDDPEAIGKQIFEVARDSKLLPGFVELLICMLDGEGYTISGWENESGFEELKKMESHNSAIKSLYQPGNTVTGFNGVWQRVHAVEILRDEVGKVKRVSHGT